MSFDLAKDSEILIFGKNRRAREIQENLLRNGFAHIVITDSSLEGIEQPYSQYTCIVALQNAVRHDEIAGMLRQKGFEKLIYLPCQDSTDKETTRMLRKVFNSLLYGTFPVGDSVVSLGTERTVKAEGDEGFLYEADGIVTFWASVANLYVNTEYPSYKSGEDREYYGETVLGVAHYRSLFQYFLGEKEAGEKLLQYCSSQGYLKESGEINQDKIQDRRELFDFFEKELRQGMDYFIDTASWTSIDEQGRVIVKEGLHRIVYLLSKGICRIPVRVPADSYYDLLPGLQSVNHVLLNREYEVKVMSRLVERYGLAWFYGKNTVETYGHGYELLSFMGRFEHKEALGSLKTAETAAGLTRFLILWENEAQDLSGEIKLDRNAFVLVKRRQQDWELCNEILGRSVSGRDVLLTERENGDEWVTGILQLGE